MRWDTPISFDEEFCEPAYEPLFQMQDAVDDAQDVVDDEISQDNESTVIIDIGGLGESDSDDNIGYPVSHLFSDSSQFSSTESFDEITEALEDSHEELNSKGSGSTANDHSSASDSFYYEFIEEEITIEEEPPFIYKIPSDLSDYESSESSSEYDFSESAFPNITENSVNGKIIQFVYSDLPKTDTTDHAPDNVEKTCSHNIKIPSDPDVKYPCDQCDDFPEVYQSDEFNDASSEYDFPGSPFSDIAENSVNDDRFQELNEFSFPSSADQPKIDTTDHTDDIVEKTCSHNVKIPSDPDVKHPCDQCEVTLSRLGKLLEETLPKTEPVNTVLLPLSLKLYPKVQKLVSDLTSSQCSNLRDSLNSISELASSSNLRSNIELDKNLKLSKYFDEKLPSDSKAESTTEFALLNPNLEISKNHPVASLVPKKEYIHDQSANQSMPSLKRKVIGSVHENIINKVPKYDSSNEKVSEVTYDNCCKASPSDTKVSITDDKSDIVPSTTNVDDVILPLEKVDEENSASE